MEMVCSEEKIFPPPSLTSFQDTIKDVYYMAAIVRAL